MNNISEKIRVVAGVRKRAVRISKPGMLLVMAGGLSVFLSIERAEPQTAASYVAQPAAYLIPTPSPPQVRIAQPYSDPSSITSNAVQDHVQSAVEDARERAFRERRWRRAEQIGHER